jgi:hypothetical protein
MSFQTLHLIQLFVMQNLTKSEACSQQQPYFKALYLVL